MHGQQSAQGGALLGRKQDTIAAKIIEADPVLTKWGEAAPCQRLTWRQMMPLKIRLVTSAAAPVDAAE